MTLSEFLLARISEDEAAARQCMDDTSDRGDGWEPGSTLIGADDGFVYASPNRVLAECAAKRHLIERAKHIESFGDHFGSFTIADLEYDEQILPVLALPFADHPDYDPAWRP